MRLRHVQHSFEVTPAVILDGICAARPDMHRSEICRLLRESDVGLDEIALELDFEEIYARALERDVLEDAMEAASREIAFQISEWLEERLGLASDQEVRMHRVM
jgi:predicted kinase